MSQVGGEDERLLEGSRPTPDDEIDYDALLREETSSSRKPLIVLAVLFAVFVAVGYGIWSFFISGDGKEEAAVQTAQVQMGNVQNTVSANGVLSPQETSSLSFKDNLAEVVSVEVEVGQQVQAGDVLATTDSGDLEDAVIQAEVNLVSAQQQLEELQEPPADSQLANADRTILQARQSLDGAIQALEDLLEGPTSGDLATAQENLVSARRDVEEATQQLEDMLAGPTTTQILQAEQDVRDAGDALQDAEDARADLLGGPSETELLAAQEDVATAQLNYDQSVEALATLTAGPTSTQILNAERAVANAEDTLQRARETLDALFEGPTQSEILQADQAVLMAENQLANAQHALAKLEEAEDPDQDAIEAAEIDVQLAEIALDEAQYARDHIDDGPDSDDVGHAQNDVDDAEAALEIAQENLAALYVEPTQSEVAAAQLGVETAAARLREAAERLADLQEGPSASDIEHANAAVDNTRDALANAQQALEDLQEGPTDLEILSAQASISTAHATLEAAQERIDELSLSPEDEIDDARSEISVAEANATVAAADRAELLEGVDPNDLRARQLDVTQAQRRLDEAIEALEDAQLTAPFDGTVTEVNIEVGETPPSQGAAIVLDTPNALRIDMTITESDIASFKLGQTGFAQVDAVDATLPIEVSLIGTTPTTNQGVVTYEVQAIITGDPLAAGAGGGLAGGNFQLPDDLQLPEGAELPEGVDSFEDLQAQLQQQQAQAQAEVGDPLPGMNASVTVTLEQALGVLTVPSGAIQQDGPNSIVEVVSDDGTTSRVTVETGLDDGTNVEIVAGALDVGQTVILTSGTETTIQPGGTGGFGGFGGTGGGGPGGGGFPGGGGGGGGGGQ